MIEALLSDLTQDETAAEALSALCVCAKTKQGREEIQQRLGDRAILTTLVQSPSPKVRKNAYRLIGALEDGTDTPLLARALQQETTLFAVPSLILSLGRLGASDALRAYTVPTSDCPAMDKHVAEIVIAYDKAMQQFETRVKTVCTKLDAPRRVLAVAPHGFAPFLLTELAALGFAGEECGDAVALVTDDMEGLYRANGMVEALLPIAEDVPLDPQAIATACSRCIGTSYRIELRGFLKERSRFIERLKQLLDGRNNPSNYDCELRIECRNAKCDLYWKLWNVPDTRYPWRKGTISAAMQPATAYMLAAYALIFVSRKHPKVFDPFCGSGTLLFAVEAQAPCASLLGVDKSGNAVETARENARAGKSRAKFVCKDILSFEAREGADLLLANLPFGNRVSTHRENEQLYRRFVRRLPNLLAQGGVAVLYTADAKLLDAELSHQPRLVLRARMRTEAGGLSPWITVLENRADPAPHAQSTQA